MIGDMNAERIIESNRKVRRYTITALALALLSYVSILALSSYHKLQDRSAFLAGAHSTQAEVVDYRQGVSEALWQLLPSGQLLLKGDTYYRPTVRYYDQQGEAQLHELVEHSAVGYQIGEPIALHINPARELAVRQDYGAARMSGPALSLSIQLGLITCILAIWIICMRLPRDHRRSDAPRRVIHPRAFPVRTRKRDRFAGA